MTEAQNPLKPFLFDILAKICYILIKVEQLDLKNHAEKANEKEGILMNNENTQNEMASPGQRMEVGVIAARYATDDLTHDEAQLLIGNPKEAGKAIKVAIREYLKNIPRTLAQIIAAGHYAFSDSRINEKNFRPSKSNLGEYILETVSYDGYMSTKAVMKDLAKKRMEAADIKDLVEYGEKNRDSQGKHMIVAIGSIWVDTNGEGHAACIFEGDDKRELVMYYERGGWHKGYCFLVRRKKAPSAS
jgi:hypothetical protein